MTTASSPAPVGRPTQFFFAWALILLAIPTWLVIALLITSVGTAVVWIGLGLWPLVVGALGGIVRLYRRMAGRLLGERIPSQYRSWTGGAAGRLRVTLTDPARWRDVGYALVAVSLGFAMGIAAMVAFLIFPVGYWVSPWLLRLWAAMTRAIVGPTGEEQLQERIGQLQESRSASLDHSAAELRRIERDLHDGAQAQLVALGMHLGLAEELVRTDPDAAAAMIADARASSQTALAELRSLVRGIHPPVLADRGLAGGIHALALAHPRPVDVRADLAVRLPAPVESAVYFAVAEALTNSAKHSGAHRVWVSAHYDGAVLTVSVGDDGRGGAALVPDGGLAGITRRIAAFDGAVTVTSPTGGPTTVTITVPCAAVSAPGRPPADVPTAPVPTVPDSTAP